MKIAYLAPDPVPAPKGAGTRITLTLATLRHLGHELDAFTLAARSGERLADVRHEAVDVGNVNYLDRMLAFRHAAGEWLDRLQPAPDLVMFRSIWEGMAAQKWAEQRGIATIYEAHGFPSVELPAHYPALANEVDTLEKLIHEEQRLLSRAALVLTPSATGRRYLMSRGVDPRRIRVVPNAVDTDLFSPSPALLDAAPPLRVVYVGTLAPWQGLETLLESLVPFRDGRVELHVVGPLKSVWRRQIRAVARRVRVHHLVHFAGATPHDGLAPILRTAHVCVAPLPGDARNALMGPCPIKLLEYMACGRPILATRLAPVEEIVKDRRDALLVSPGSPAALSDGIRWMIDHPKEREELAFAARRAALARWTPAQFRGRLAEALSGLEGALE